jgi:hypothetical protein
MADQPQRWKHRTGGIVGTLIKHNKKTGCVVLRLDDGRTYRGRIGNLKRKWERVED